MNNRGNVLFLILIGVALFAALSYAIVNSGRTNDGQLSSDKLKLAVSRILQYSARVEQAVSRLRIFNGCGFTELNFENPVVSGYEFSAPEECKVFQPSGGAINFMLPEPEWLVADPNLGGTDFYGEFVFTERSKVQKVGETGAGVNEYSEIIMILPWVTKDLCYKLLDRLGISGDPVVDSASFTVLYKTNSLTGGGELDAGRGRTTNCIQAGSGHTNFPNAYVFYHVLYIR